MKHNEPFEDDGRTVADMSGIEHDSIWLPRRRKQGHTPAQQPQQAADRPWEEDPQLTGKERLWAILGALKATLLICGVYLLGLLALLALLFLVPTLFIVFQTLQEKIKPVEFTSPDWCIQAEIEENQKEPIDEEAKTDDDTK